MSIYLPVAELPVNALFILLLSAGVGYLSGLVGVGGGFIMTPLLIFAGIPPSVAVATELSQVTASSVAGALAYWRRRLLDMRMGLLLTLGGVLGSWLGVRLFRELSKVGQIDVLIALSYVFFLSLIGVLMMAESTAALRRRRSGAPAPRRRRRRTLAHMLPLRMRFPKSGLYISAIPPMTVGLGVGVLAGVMGVGGGFILVPAMIYLLRMPTNVVIGTSFLYILIVSALSTYLHAAANRTVDVVLALLLILGGVVGAQLGVRAGAKLPAEQLRAILAVVVLGAGLKLLWDLVAPPGEFFSLQIRGPAA